MLMPTFYLSHGGGPWPWTTGPMHDAHARLGAAMRELPSYWPARPQAVLMVTAHWEGPAFQFSAQPHPPTLHDYYGFPPETYRISYPAPGHPALAQEAARLVAAAGLPTRLEYERGYDHGTFVPMAVFEPGASIPVVQMSLREGFDPRDHVLAGQALRPLREQGVVIVGSGSSFHNQRPDPRRVPADSAAFDAWLFDTSVQHSGEARAERLHHWEQAPAGRAAHPREEHLLPLMVAAGAALDEPGHCIYRQNDFLGGGSVSSYAFGNDLARPAPR